MKNPSQPIPRNWAARFFTVWGGQSFSLFGSALVQFALVWHLTRETGSATVLAIATLVALLPQIVLGPFVGALVDRWNRRIIMMVADGCDRSCNHFADLSICHRSGTSLAHLSHHDDSFAGTGLPLPRYASVYQSDGARKTSDAHRWCKPDIERGNQHHRPSDRCAASRSLANARSFSNRYRHCFVGNTPPGLYQHTSTNPNRRN